MRTNEPTLALIQRAFDAWFDDDEIPKEIAEELEWRRISPTALEVAFDYDDLFGELD